MKMTQLFRSALPAPKVQRLTALLLLTLTLAGCDKCGHWVWSKDGGQGVPLSCHGGPDPRN
jgi:hypothetical protein